MTASAIRIGAGEAYPLLSGGWMCIRAGDAFPIWRHDEQDAARLLRSWLPTTDVPPVDVCPCRGGRDAAVVDGRDLDPAARVPNPRGGSAPGLFLIPPEDSPGATNGFVRSL